VAFEQHPQDAGGATARTPSHNAEEDGDPRRRPPAMPSWHRAPAPRRTPAAASTRRAGPPPQPRSAGRPPAVVAAIRQKHDMMIDELKHRLGFGNSRK
jgi:hypothetical protein